MGERLPTDGRDLEFQLLGPFAVRAHGRTVAVASPKHRILLAALLLQADRTVPVDALADAVWGDAPPDKPRKALQLHVIRLRKLLKDAAGETAGAIIVTDADGKVLSIVPEARFVARANREFLGRAVRFLAEAGIRQFIDLGTGLPTQANVHEVVHRIDPGARVVYVDNDPVVIAHAQALLHAEDTTTIIEADVRDPESVLGHSGLRALIDFKEPVAVLMAAILHLVTDAENPDGIITAFRNAMAPGSYLVLSHVTTDPRPQAKVPVTDVYRTANAPMVPRTRDRVRRFFTGLDLVDPGVVYAPEWRPDGERPLSEPQRSFIFAGVGYKHALP